MRERIRGWYGGEEEDYYEFLEELARKLECESREIKRQGDKLILECVSTAPHAAWRAVLTRKEHRGRSSIWFEMDVLGELGVVAAGECTEGEALCWQMPIINKLTVRAPGHRDTYLVLGKDRSLAGVTVRPREEKIIVEVNPKTREMEIILTGERGGR